MGGLLKQIWFWLPALEPKHRRALQRGNTSQSLQQPQVSAQSVGVFTEGVM